ncbi:hypothetical protein GCM10010415_58300 [Streptomyces atrovirens]
MPWLDRPGSCPVTVRWSRAPGLPRGLPDGLGPAVRVEDADGPGSTLDLLFTSSRPAGSAAIRLSPRPGALKGPHSALPSCRVGDRERVPAAFPVTGGRRDDVRPTLRQELARGPVRFAPRATAPDGHWCTFADLSPQAVRTAPSSRTVSCDPYRPPPDRSAPHRAAAPASRRRVRRFPPRADRRRSRRVRRVLRRWVPTAGG